MRSGHAQWLQYRHWAGKSVPVSLGLPVPLKVVAAVSVPLVIILGRMACPPHPSMVNHEYGGWKFLAYPWPLRDLIQ